MEIYFILKKYLRPFFLVISDFSNFEWLTDLFLCNPKPNPKPNDREKLISIRLFQTISEKPFLSFELI
jgi:hypothetical protein